MSVLLFVVQILIFMWLGFSIANLRRTLKVRKWLEEIRKEPTSEEVLGKLIMLSKFNYFI